MDYYVIYDCEKKIYYSYITYIQNDILGYVIALSEKNNTKMSDMRMYRFATKKAYNAFMRIVKQ